MTESGMELNPELFQDPTVPGPTTAELSALATRLNYSLSDDELKQCHSLVTDALKGFNRLDHLVEPTLPVKYPRTPGYRPTAEENPYRAWYWKSTIKGADSGKLSGKKIAIKDNVMVAGVPMMNGCRALEGTIPDVDATVVTRLLDAGGTILGKSTCENLCFSACSHTTGYGPVLNFHDQTRSAGGSSSGSAVLVMAGEVDMAIGGDQGGSVRLPSCWNGSVGIKGTWGLVPYTGAAAIEPTIDHLGPIARTVHDCALMLEVIAGYDNGLDHRQPPNIVVPEYTKEIEVDNLNGMRIGILQEGFGHDVSEEAVDRIVKEAAQKLTSVGAKVEDVSIPMQKHSGDIWAGFGLEGAYHCMLRGSLHGLGYRGYYPTNNMKISGAALKHDTKHLSDKVKSVMLTGAYLNETFHGQYYGRCQNLARLLRQAYDDVLKDYDVLIMPTIPFVAQKLPKEGEMTFEERSNYCVDMIQNTMAADITGHPALSINAGWVDKLPVGMTIVGKHWDETTVLKVARAHEKNYGK
ncbi:amidase-like isoform X3 [Amphiura filiformis]|uniref:amidase-like isoform X3 n=1 Tax=Amphiura filiformis TaxID=82378 RepID=UPI003B20EB0D